MGICVHSWHAIIVDGHSVEELCKAFSQARHQPTAIIAKTIKGKGIPGNHISLCTPHLQMQHPDSGAYHMQRHQHSSLVI